MNIFQFPGPNERNTFFKNSISPLYSYVIMNGVIHEMIPLAIDVTSNNNLLFTRVPTKAAGKFIIKYPVKKALSK